MYGMLKQQWVEGSYYMPSRGHALHVYIRQGKDEREQIRWLVTWKAGHKKI